ncbi:MAG TPA: hypothetical protein VFD82_20570 [Planctomycetota bacterium]|nr:hypothetical protein [Planctomycetota bacterium]
MLVRLTVLAWCGLASCAAAPEAASPRILVQVLRPGADEFDEDPWSAPLDRCPRVTHARLGQVVVEGIWTVYFDFDRADAEWFDGLRREHRDYRLMWNGFRLITDGRSGYIMNMGGKQNAERALAQPPWSLVHKAGAL